MKPLTAMRGLALVIVALGVTGVYAQRDAQAPTVTKSIMAVGYQVGNRTRVDLKATSLVAQVSGEAEVDPKRGSTKVEIEVAYLPQPGVFGNEFLTYVVWAVSPEGSTYNLGEIQISAEGGGKLTGSTPLQTFSLFVTAEPYFAVPRPSEFIVLENEIRNDTKGSVFAVNQYPLMKRSQYEKPGNPPALSMHLKKVPLELYEARNALDIARSHGGEAYAANIFTKAEDSLKRAENALARQASRNEIVSAAKQAVQISEDARALAVQRQEEERVAALDLAEARRIAERDARRLAALVRAEAEDARLRAQAGADAEVRRQKELVAAREAQMRAEASAGKAREDAARQAAEAQRLRLQAERDQAELRQRLLQLFSTVLDTTDTDRGLVVNLSDVLFDSGQFTLSAAAREGLARLAGIVINYPGLNLQAEGHTDNVGSAELNQELSEKRAQAVRQFLVSQGVPSTSITFVGLGFTVPVEPNTTAAGRQKNRRVELIVSGEVIGLKVDTARK